MFTNIWYLEHLLIQYIYTYTFSRRFYVLQTQYIYLSGKIGQQYWLNI